VAFSQTNQFTVAPDGDYPSQAHGTFASRQKVARASFAAVIRANCVQADVSVTPTGSGWRVETQGKTVTFDGVNVDVQR
jgi:hypothetical protein